MKFHFTQLTLWLKNEELRVLTFKPGKVNVITGESNTGKTAILEIIDYCFFASKPNIAESIINENVLWYGITFSINSKLYSIARAALKGTSGSDEYFFSSVGEIPQNVPKANISEEEIKDILEPEFSINHNIKFPYGGNFIKVGSKISLRYFLMFNTISDEIIQSKYVFFDKQEKRRYKEALERIFDLALQIDTVENRLKREKKQELKKEIDKLIQKKEIAATAKNNFDQELKSLVAQAKEFGFIPMQDDLASALKHLKEILETNAPDKTESDFSIVENLKSKQGSIRLKINHLKKFNAEYERYKKSSSEFADSLKPVEYLQEQVGYIIQGTDFDAILSSLAKDLQKIKSAVKRNSPIDLKISDLLAQYKREFDDIEQQLKLYPIQQSEIGSITEKYRFLGALEEKLKLYSSSSTGIVSNIQGEIDEKQKEYDSIHVEDVSEKRDLTIELIEEYIRDYMQIAGDALANYKSFLPFFDYENKSLKLRRPKTSDFELVGSSSNHMFLHLFFSLSLHAVIRLNSSPFVAPFIIIDQPSRPYYGDSGKKQKEIYEDTDEGKIVAAFQVLNDFISASPINQDFQMIVFEHVPMRLLKNKRFPNITVRAEFIENALIPPDYLDKVKQNNTTQSEE